MTHTIPAPPASIRPSVVDTSTRSTRAPRAPRGNWRDRAADPVFNFFAIGMLLVAIVAILYPLYFIVIASAERFSPAPTIE